MKGEVHVRKDPISINLLFFLPFFQKCLFVCLRSRAGKTEGSAKKQNKTKKRRRQQQLAMGPARGFICLHILDVPDNEKKIALKDFLILFCTIIFLVTLGVNVWRRRKIIVLI